MSPSLSVGFAKSGAELNDRLPELEIAKAELSVPAFDKVTSSPSASVVVISNTFVCTLVTYTLVERSTNVGALSLRLFMLTRTFGEVADKDPSLATTAKE